MTGFSPVDLRDHAYVGAQMQPSMPVTNGGTAEEPVEVTVTALRLAATMSYFRPTTGFTAPTDFTGCIWVRPQVDRNTYSGIYSFETAGHASSFVEMISGANGSSPYVYHHGGDFATGPDWVFGTTWYFMAYKVGASGACTVWRGTEGDSALTKYTGTVSTDGTFSQVTLGSTNFDSTEWFNGDICLARGWNAQLSDAEMLAEFLSPTAVRSANIHGDWRLANNATRFVDSSAAGNTLIESVTAPTRAEVTDGPTFYV